MMSRPRNAMPNSVKIGAGIALAALLVRVLFLILRPYDAGDAEMVRVAVNFAKLGFLGNPYAIPTGPTAHVAPVYPLILASFYDITRTKQGMIFAAGMLGAIAVALECALLPWFARTLNMPVRAAYLAGAVLAVPVFTWVEIGGSWETPLVALSLLALVGWTARGIISGDIEWKQGALIGAGWGAGMLLAPNLATVFAVLLLVALVTQRRQPMRWLGYAVAASLAAALVLLPYSIRNWKVLGGFAFVRDNFGLEFAVSNGPKSHATIRDNLGPDGPLVKNHPFLSVEEAARVKELGELAYNRARLQEGKAWVAAHPAVFAKLTAQRLWLFWVSASTRLHQSALGLVCGLLALVGLVQLYRRDRLSAGIMAAALVGFSIPYLFVQQDARYSYPLYGIKLMLASAAVLQLISIAALRRRSANTLLAEATA
jgi:hypothetical protein